MEQLEEGELKGLKGEAGKENDGFEANCPKWHGQMNGSIQNLANSEGIDLRLQSFGRDRDVHGQRIQQKKQEVPSFLPGFEEATGAFTTDGDTSIFDDQFVLADGGGQGLEQQERRTNKAAAAGKLSSSMFYMKQNTADLQDPHEARKGLFSAGGEDKSDSQMLPELNLSRRGTTMLGSTQSFSRKAANLPAEKKSIAQAFEDQNRLHSQSYTNGRGPLKAYQHSSHKQGLNNFMSPSYLEGASMASGFLPSQSQDLQPDKASEARGVKPVKKQLKGIASQRVAEARQRIQRLNNQRDLLVQGVDQPKRSFIQENRLKAGQIQRRTQSTKMYDAKHSTMGSFYESKAADSARKQGPPGTYSISSQQGIARLTKKNLQVLSKNYQGRKNSQLSQRSFASHQSRKSAVKSINSARSRKSSMSQRSHNKPDRFAELYSVQNASAAKGKPLATKNGRLWSSKTIRGYQNQQLLAIKKFEQLDELMSQNIQNLKNEVQNLQVENYLHDSQSLCTFARTGARSGTAQGSTSLRDMPIRVLDSLIENEERKNNGFSVYNRGHQLKASLIDAERVRAFVQQQERQQAQQRLMGGAPEGTGKRGSRRDRAAERLPTKTTTKGDPVWDNMMEFFKANPAALMDALPTPPGSDCDSEAGDHEASKLGSSFAKASIKSTKSKTLGLNMAHLPYRASNKKGNNDTASQRSGQFGLQRKSSVRSIASNKSFQSQGSRSGANAFRYNKGQPHNGRLASDAAGGSLGLSTSAAYGLPNRQTGGKTQPSWRLQSVKSTGAGPKPGTADASASKRLFNRGTGTNNARVNSTTGFFRGPPGGRASDRGNVLARQQPKPGRSAHVNRTMPHQRQHEARRLSNRASAAPASGNSSFLPTISPSGRMSFSNLSAAYHGRSGHVSFYGAQAPMNEAGSLLPQASQGLRASLGPPPLPASQHPGVKDVSRRKQAAPVAQKEYIDLHLDDGDPVFQDYIINQYDRLHKFQEQSLGTLTVTQLSSLSTLQVTIANKNSLAQQLRQTAKLVCRELVGSGQMCLHDGEEQERPVYLLEYQHFEQSLGPKNLLIESVNKSLDKVQKLMRVRSEFLSLLASVHSCLNMFNDISSSSKEVFDIQAANKDSEAADSHEEVLQQSVQALSRKIKIFQKAAQLSIQQVDRFVVLFNKNMERLKLKKFLFVPKPMANPREAEADLAALDIRESMGLRVQQTTDILQSIVSGQ